MIQNQKTSREPFPPRKRLRKKEKEKKKVQTNHNKMDIPRQLHLYWEIYEDYREGDIVMCPFSVEIIKRLKPHKLKTPDVEKRVALRKICNYEHPKYRQLVKALPTIDDFYITLLPTANVIFLERTVKSQTCVCDSCYYRSLAFKDSCLVRFPS